MMKKGQKEKKRKILYKRLHLMTAYDSQEAELPVPDHSKGHCQRDSLRLNMDFQSLDCQDYSQYHFSAVIATFKHFTRDVPFNCINNLRNWQTKQI